MFLIGTTVKQEQLLDLISVIWRSVKKGKADAQKMEEELEKIIEKYKL